MTINGLIHKCFFRAKEIKRVDGYMQMEQQVEKI